MAETQYKSIVIGAGHNGLVAAAYLARAGLRPLLLERRKIIGGGTITEEIYPGFRCPTLAHSTEPLLPGLATDLKLYKHGFTVLDSETQLFAPNPNGSPITIYKDVTRTIGSLKQISPHDADRYPDFAKSFVNIGRMLAPLLKMTPADLDSMTLGDYWNFGKLGVQFRSLNKRDASRLLRWTPMAVADLSKEWFETSLLRALIEARGIQGAFAGPRSAGTSVNLLIQAALTGSPLTPAAFVRGGMGALSNALALAACKAGANIRTNAMVKNVRVKDNKVIGVCLASGETLESPIVVSNADPQTTMLKLVRPEDLNPEFLLKIENYRSRGSAAKVNLALSGLPAFLDAESASLSGRIHIGHDTDYLEKSFDSAKYGECSPSPYLDITIPSINDPSLAPKGAHVMSIYAQFAPYSLKDGNWEAHRECFGDVVIKTLEAYSPKLREMILCRQVITPVDMENEYGISGGHPLHGEPSLDQMFACRPLLGWARYRTPIKGLYLCGSGTHPGGGVTGAPGLNASREVIADLKTSNP